MARLAPGLVRGDDGVVRCAWGASAPEYIAYHDGEWGIPSVDDVQLFEKICLEGFQCGLSWLTILRKREAFRRAFRDFMPERVARFDARSVERLLGDPGIVRHRGKIESAIRNARCALELREREGSLAAFFWRFVPPEKTRPKRVTYEAVRRLTETEQSRALSRELRKLGWSYVGPTTLYAFMQAMGLVNDHIEGCAARAPAERARRLRGRTPLA